ncbi:hypothetical protein SDC9_46799 [bioreactor metagenome]|uniref:DUF551 domain-containing protein n=1 Tax=bioreactor metagenome TaxID=1076179 RepID=A0A644WA02_9ZZZZ
MNASEIIKDLRSLLPPQVDYAELVCAEGFFHGQHYVWTEPEPYIISAAADYIESLQTEVEGMRSNWYKCASNYQQKCKDVAELESKINNLLDKNLKTESPRWVPVENGLPKSGEHVWLCCEVRPSGRQYMCDGYYATPKSIACSNPEGAIEYDEDTDEYYLLEGWYEVIKNWDDFSSVCIDDFVTHWMPLPEFPEKD